MWSDSIANQQTVYPHSHIPFRNCVALLLWLFALGLQQNTYLGLSPLSTNAKIFAKTILAASTAKPYSQLEQHYHHTSLYSHPQCSSDARFSPLGDG